jgi:hypothetical protein
MGMPVEIRELIASYADIWELKYFDHMYGKPVELPAEFL